MLKLSIVTVCFNSEKGIAKTIKSILLQEFNGFEHIIIDGGSRDRTNQIIKRNYKTYKKNSIKLIHVSEPDKGIYDAMNKGTKLSNGEYVLYLNSGDQLWSKNTLLEVFQHKKLKKRFCVLYGDNINGKEFKRPQPIKYLKSGIMFGNHQSMFFNKKKLGHDLYYNEYLKINGDYDLLNRIFIKKGEQTFLYLKKTISIYEGGGISSKPSYNRRKEKYKLLYKNYGFRGVLRGIIYKLKC